MSLYIFVLQALELYCTALYIKLFSVKSAQDYYSHGQNPLDILEHVPEMHGYAVDTEKDRVQRILVVTTALCM